MIRKGVFKTCQQLAWKWWGWAGLIGLGWLVRLRPYWFNRSIWLDEAQLANNVIRHSLIELITVPLSSSQAAPIGFLVVTKLLVSWFSESEKVLRLLPLAAGMALVPIALWLSFQVFEKTPARLAFVSLFSFSPILIIYTTEFKQYMLDVSFGMLILAIGAYVYRIQTKSDEYAGKREWRFSMAALWVTGCVGVWFSHPFVFFLFGIGVSLFGLALYHKRKRDLLILSGIGLSWLASCVPSIWLIQRNVLDNQNLFNFWAGAFAPNPLDGWTELRWYLDTFLAAVFLSFMQRGIAAQQFIPAWYSLLNLVLAIICLGGATWMVAQRKWLGWVIFLISAAAWMASVLGYYPLRGRLFLFISPIIFLLAAGLIEALDQKRLKFMNWLVSLSLIGVVLVPSVRLFIQPFAYFEIRGPLQYLVKESVPGEDVVAVSGWSLPAYQYYSPRFALENLELATAINSAFNVEEFLQKVCSYPDRDRMWLVFSHRMEEAQKMLAELRTLGPN